jgi:multiple sugar transport system substrate-binding protein
MLDYNAKKLKDAGFDNPPKTWKEFSDQAAAAKSKGVDKYPIAFGAIDWSWYLMALSMGDPMFDKDLNPVFADKDSKARAAMKTLLGYFKDELISPEMISGTTNQHTLFESGTGVFHQSWQGADKVMNNPKASKQAPDVKYMLMPDVGNTWSLDAAIGIAANSENKDAAWEFIKWYIGPDNQTAIYNGVGLIPSRPSVQDAVNKASPMQQFDLIAEQAKHINYLPRYAKWWGPFTAKVTEQIKTSAQTGGSADDAVDALAKVWNDLKTEYSGK